MERRTRYVGIIVILLIIGAIGVGLFARVPQVSVSGVAVSALNLTVIGLNITLIIDNPYPVPIPLKSVDYSVAYNRKETPLRLIEGEQHGIMIQPGSNEISIPVLISDAAIIHSLYHVLTTGEINLTISGNVTPDIFGITPAIPFRKEVVTQVNVKDQLLAGIKTVVRSLSAEEIEYLKNLYYNHE